MLGVALMGCPFAVGGWGLHTGLGEAKEAAPGGSMGGWDPWSCGPGGS